MTEPAERISELVEHARGGCGQSFGALVKSFERPLLAFLLGRLKNGELAEEIAQESFVRAWCLLRDGAKPESFGAWLFGIARKVALEMFRAEAGREEKRTKIPQSSHPERAEILHSRAELHSELLRIIQDLPEPYSEVLLLRSFAEMSIEDIAKKLGRPTGTVTKQLSRAYAMVADKLQRLRGFTTMLRTFLKKSEEE